MAPSTYWPLAALSLLARARGLALSTPKPALDNVMQWIECCGGRLNGLRVQETDGIRARSTLRRRAAPPQFRCAEVSQAARGPLRPRFVSSMHRALSSHAEGAGGAHAPMSLLFPCRRLCVSQAGLMLSLRRAGDHRADRCG